MSDTTIQERLAVIEQVVTRLEQRLFGNGQPGEVQIIRERVRRLEAWAWRAAGAVALALMLLEAFHR